MNVFIPTRTNCDQVYAWLIFLCLYRILFLCMDGCMHACMYALFCWTWVFTCYSTHVKARGELEEVDSLLSSCRPQGLNSGHQVWWHVPLPTEAVHWPKVCFYWERIFDWTWNLQFLLEWLAIKFQDLPVSNPQWWLPDACSATHLTVKRVLGFQTQVLSLHN